MEGSPEDLNPSMALLEEMDAFIAAAESAAPRSAVRRAFEARSPEIARRLIKIVLAQRAALNCALDHLNGKPRGLLDEDPVKMIVDALDLTPKKKPRPPGR